MVAPAAATAIAKTAATVHRFRCLIIWEHGTRAPHVNRPPPEDHPAFSRKAVAASRRQSLQSDCFDAWTRRDAICWPRVEGAEHGLEIKTFNNGLKLGAAVVDANIR
jgi:hypothetical protein